MVGFWDNQASTSKSHSPLTESQVWLKGGRHTQNAPNPYHLGIPGFKSSIPELGTETTYLFLIISHLQINWGESWHFVLGCSVLQPMNMVCMLMIFFISVLSFSAQILQIFVRLIPNKNDNDNVTFGFSEINVPGW